MTTIFSPSCVGVNFSATLAAFGAGLFPAPAIEIDHYRDDPRTFHAPVSAADLDEQTAHSIARTIAEETATYYGRIVEMDIDEEVERLAEQAEFEARLDLYC